jgi:hypothetical protein
MNEIKRILDTEGYVVVDPDIMHTPEFRFMHAIKDEIRAYKWKAEQMNRGISWSEAKHEYIQQNSSSLTDMLSMLLDMRRGSEEYCETIYESN